MIELTQISVQNLDRKAVEAEVTSNWTEKVTYRGQNVFALVYSSEIENRFAEKLPSERQECFLGYQLSTDRFLMGFDCWLGEEDEYFPTAFWFTLDVDTGQISDIEDVYDLNPFFYSSLGTLQENYPDLIGVRLD